MRWVSTPVGRFRSSNLGHVLGAVFRRSTKHFAENQPLPDPSSSMSSGPPEDLGDGSGAGRRGDDLRHWAPVAAKTDLESTASLSGNQDYRLRVP
jgi:hypothetical protein